MSQPKRLAITISGAVSLGSYEAGVLFEVLEALRRNNEHPEAKADPSKRVVIDVLCGASAGGMTAAIAAQALLDTRGRGLGDPLRNAFYQPWVLDADLELFLRDTPADDPKLALLASSQVQRIAERYLSDSVSSEAEPHPAAAPTIKLGLAMSNLQGVDYHRQTIGAGGHKESFVYTRFQDEFFRTVRDNDNAVPGLDWPVIREAALACGAFPVAFRPRDLVRHIDEYQTQHKGFDPLQFAGQARRTYTYVDGGLFHNEPLGMARDLVAGLNPGGPPDDPDTRFYLFVSPDAKTSKRPETKRDSDGRLPERIESGTEALPPLIKHLIGAIFAQGRFQDWIMASKVNERVRQLDIVARALAEALLNPPAMVPGQPALPVAIATVADAFLPAFFAASANPANALQLELTRLRQSYTGFGDAAGVDYLNRLSAADQQIWLRAILLFEKTAKLENKDVMTIFTITASTEELAGDPIAAFGGFLWLKARQHDYAVGRQKAQEWLKNNAGPGGLFPLFNREQFPAPAPAPDPDLGGMKLAQTPAAKRRDLRDRVSSRVTDALGLWKIVAWIPRLALGRYLDKKLELNSDQSNPPRRGPRG
jgi:predicted acylesterase/phospholipase RssA